ARLRKAVHALPGAAPRGRLVLPRARDEPGLLKPVERRVQRPFLELQRPAPGLGQAAQDLEPVRLALLERRQGHRLQVPPERITADRFHPIYLVCLNRFVKRWPPFTRWKGLTARYPPSRPDLPSATRCSAGKLPVPSCGCCSRRTATGRTRTQRDRPDGYGATPFFRDGKPTRREWLLHHSRPVGGCPRLFRPGRSASSRPA